MEKDEFIERAKLSNKIYVESKTFEDLLIFELWQILKLEKILKIAMADCETERVSVHYRIYGLVKKNKRKIATYEISPWPTVTLLASCGNKHAYANALIAEGAIRPIKDVHRILDWHSLENDDYVQVLANKDRIIHYAPLIPTIDELNQLKEQVKQK